MTEFVPVSSSGHLVFFQSLFGLEEPQLFFDVMLHLGTLLAVLIFFRHDIWKIAAGTVETLKGRNKERQQTRLLLWIILATIPTGLMGVLLKPWVEPLFSQPRFVGLMLMVTGVFLWLTRRASREGSPLEKMKWIHPILIGIAQGIAILPGISRSGATLSTGLYCGMERELAGKFSFLLSIPVILGAALLELRKVSAIGNLSPTLIGMAAAFILGILSLKFLMKIIKMGRISVFSYYCWGMGVLIVLLAR